MLKFVSRSKSRIIATISFDSQAEEFGYRFENRCFFSIWQIPEEDCVDGGAVRCACALSCTATYLWPAGLRTGLSFPGKAFPARWKLTQTVRPNTAKSWLSAHFWISAPSSSDFSNVVSGDNRRPNTRKRTRVSTTSLGQDVEIFTFFWKK